jgi:hypothetical protein
MEARRLAGSLRGAKVAAALAVVGWTLAVTAAPRAQTEAKALTAPRPQLAASPIAAPEPGIAAPQPEIAATTLSRAPYLQQVTDRSAIVVWRTSTAAACTLAYLPSGGPSTSIMTASGTEHVVALNGLQPGTRYDYTVRSGSVLAGGANSYLRTAPSPGFGTPLRLLVWGDSGTGTATQMAVAAVLDAQTADFGLHVGDIIYPSGEASNYNPRYFTPYAPLVAHTPVWAIPGNHDVGNAQTFLDTWHLPTNPVTGSERFYSFDYGDVHCIGLDTNQAFTSAILSWIAADLDASTRRWKFVFFHHTMYSCGSYHGSSSSLIATLGPLFDAHGVDMVFYGHDHHYERSYPMRANQPVSQAQNPDYTAPGGTIYVISGAAGGTRSVGTTCPHTARALAVPSFVRVDIVADLLTLEAVDSNSQVIDRMTLRKSVSPPPPPPPPPPADSLHVLAPVGSETLAAGNVTDLRWAASPGVGPVRIQLSRSGTSGPWETLFDMTPNDGSELWTVTGPASTRCWLRVSEASDGVPSDLTDASFSITESGGGGPAPGSVAHINFQPSTSPVPAGYFADFGLLYDPVRGSGWSTTVQMRERGILPADPRDTFADITNTSPASWEMVLANGDYRVSLICGDPSATATHRIAIEGQLVVQDVTTNTGQFLEKNDIPVRVSDGRLTLTLGGGSEITHTKLCALLVAAGTAPVHELTSPAGGETYCAGSLVPLRWTGATAGALVRLDLSRNGNAGPWQSLGLVPDDGQENWGAIGPAASNCMLRLLDTGGNVMAQTAEPFTIAESHLELLHPNGGEIWATGTTRNFEWSSTCFTGSVRIDMSRSGPSGPWTTLFPSTPNDGFEAYTVRPSDVGYVYARVVALPFSVPLDQSDASFQIVDTPPAEPQPNAWRIDFLPAGADAATGYDADSGALYSSTRGYGWNVTTLAKKRDMLPDDCRDSFVQVVNNTTASWNLDVPNGEYEVSFTCGDPYTSGTHRVALEGGVAVADVYAIGGTYVSRTNVPVLVRDHQLTVTLGGSGQITSTKLCCIEVHAAGNPSRGPVPKHGDIDGSLSSVTSTATGLEVGGRPFRGGASFAIGLAEPGSATVTVHDVRGRRVATLHEGPLAAGRTEMTWDGLDATGRRVPSGVYFLRLDTPSLRTSRKLVLIR